MILTALSFVGCQGTTETTPNGSTESKPAVASDQAEELIKSVVGILESAVDDASFPTVLKQLNDFVERRGESIQLLDDPTLEQLRQLLGPEAPAIGNRRTFDQADAEYLKNTLFLRQVARAVAGNENDELAIAQKLFDWTVRYIQLLPAGFEPPGPPFEVALRGTGDVNERTWVFLELLRQAGLSGCLVATPKADDRDVMLPWFCGLLLKEQIHLFDPLIGLPILSARGGVATLEELKATPSLLDAFTVEPELAYPFKAEQLKQTALLLILEPQMVAPRLSFLESRLSGNSRAVLHIDFAAHLARSVAAHRKVQAEPDIRVWQYPLIVRRSFEQSRRDVYLSTNLTWIMWPTLANLFSQAGVFKVPMNDSPRIQQLTGRHEEAIRAFVELDLGNFAPMLAQLLQVQNMRLPVEMRRRMVAQTPQDIIYFMGLGKLELARPQPEVARDWFNRYKTRYASLRYRPGDIVNAATVSTRLQSEGTGTEPTALQRIWKLMTEEHRKKAITATREEVAQALSSVLEKQELYLKEPFDSILSKQPVGGELRWLLARNDLSAEEIVRRNRWLIDAAFPEDLAPGLDPWLPGVVRHTAEALRKDGKIKEAIEHLRDPKVYLQAIHRRANLALAKRWEAAAAAPSATAP